MDAKNLIAPRLTRLPMLLHCLGTTGYHPSRHRHTACYAVPEADLVLDAGTGMFRLGELLERDHFDVLISHSHVDHIVGLTYLLGLGLTQALREVRIWGEASKLEAIRRHLFDEALFPVLPEFFRWCPLPEGPWQLACGARVQHFPLQHPGGSTGYRIDWPAASLAYVTDTTATPEADYVPRIRDANLLLHECYFQDDQQEWAVKTGHSWTTGAATVAAKANVGRALMIHINPLETGDDPIGLAAARKIYPHVDVAQDEMIVEF